MTTTARLVATARAVVSMAIGPLTAEQAEKLLQLDLALRLLDATPPAQPEATDEELYDAFYRALRSPGWKDRTYDKSEALGRRAIFALGAARGAAAERARCVARLRDTADEADGLDAESLGFLCSAGSALRDAADELERGR